MPEIKNTKQSIRREIGIILLTSLFAAVVYNGFSDTGLPLIREAPPKISVSDEEIFGAEKSAGAADSGLRATTDPEAREPFRVITLAQMKKILHDKVGFIGDARTPDEFAEGHIAGAVNLYAMEPENYVEMIADLPRDTLVALYCSNTHCHFARSVAELLDTFGFTNILIFDDGYDAWIDAGLPVVTGREGE